jgi:serine protease Do
MRRALVALVLVATVLGATDAFALSWLGVRIRDLSEPEMEEIASHHGIREGFGVVIVEVLEGTPAARSGLRAGDIVVAFGERPVTETRMLQRLIAAAPTEAETRLTILRREGRRQLSVRLTTMPREVLGDRVAAEFGFALRDGQPQGELAGAAVASGTPAIAVVLRGSAAEKAGVQVGDVLLQIGDRAVMSRDAARDALADTPLDRPLTVALRRGERRVSLTIARP